MKERVRELLVAIILLLRKYTLHYRNIVYINQEPRFTKELVCDCATESHAEL